MISAEILKTVRPENVKSLWPGIVGIDEARVWDEVCRLDGCGSPWPAPSRKANARNGTTRRAKKTTSSSGCSRRS